MTGALVVAGGIQPLTFAEYQKIQAVNWSTLKEMRKSPLHYAHGVMHRRPDTSSLALGRAVHAAVFEPDRFVLDYVVYKGARRAGKDWEAFEAVHANDSIIKLDEYERCLAIRDALTRHPVAGPYLKAGHAESSLTWTNKETDLPCKGRLDWISTSRLALVDLKTTADLDHERFRNTAFRYGYHVQLAYYADGLAALTGERPPVVILAVESAPPHDVTVYQYDADTLWRGTKEYQELLARLVACQKAGIWPGRFPEEVVPLALPPWAWDDTENIDGLGLDFGGAEGTR